MRRNRSEAADAYTGIIANLSGVLCQGDSLLVFGFPATATERMQAVVHIGGRLHRRAAREAAARVLDTRVRHTDFAMVLQSIREDLTADIIYLATDGSFYPADTDSIRYPELQERLEEFADAALALRQKPVYALGVRSDHEYAIDPELSVEWPDGSMAAWWYDGKPYNLHAISGSELLKAVFGAGFFHHDEAWLHSLLFARDRPMWGSLGYESPAGVHLRDIQIASVDHVLFVAPGGMEAPSCPETSSGSRVQRVSTAPSGRSGFCSLNAPTPAEIADLERMGVTQFAYRQRPVFDLSIIPSTIYGLHQLVVGTHDKGCSHRSLRRYLQAGEPWPPEGPQAGVVEIRPMSAGGLSKTLDLLALPGTSCLVPSAEVPYNWDVAGPHLVYFRGDAGAMVKPISLGPRRMVAGPTVRRLDGGFVLGNASRLSTCAELSMPMGAQERLTLLIPGRAHTLTANHDTGDCALPPPVSSGTMRKRYVFSSVVARYGPMRSGYLFLGPEADTLAEGADSEWYPLSIKPSGRFYLPPLGLAFSFLVGLVAQSGILAWERRRTGMRGLSRKGVRHIVGRILRAGFLSVLLCGAILGAVSTEWDGVEAVPLSMLVGVVGCLLKLLLSFYLPTLLEEGLSS
jgi:hypothetical protein